MSIQEENAQNIQISNIKWNRVHFLSPLLMVWKTLAALFALIVYNINQTIELQYIYQAITIFSLYVVLISVLVLAVIIAFCYLSWTRMGYALDKTNVYLKHGIVFKQERYIKLSRIQTVDIMYPIVGRIFGLGQIKIESAGSNDSNITIAYMKEEQLNDLRNTILALMAGVKTSKRIENQTIGVQEKDFNGVSELNGANSYFEKDTNLSNEEKLGIHELDFYAEKAPEKTIYEIPYKKFAFATITSFLVSMASLLLVVVPLLILGYAIQVLSLINGEDIDTNIMENLSALSFMEIMQIGLAPLLVTVAIFSAGLWKPLSTKFGYTLKISPDGFRTKTGLTSLKHETIPPNRIHALIILQPFVWRLFKSWKMNTVKAAVMEVNVEVDDETYVPIVETEKINDLVHLVFKKLSNKSENLQIDEEIVLEGLLGKKEGKYFKQLAPVARLFHPFAYNKMAYYISENVVMIRSGFLRRKLVIIPHERAQSLGIQQNFITAKLGVTTLKLDLVKMGHISHIVCLPTVKAKENLDYLTEYFRMRHLAEPKEEWMKRVYSSEQ